MAQPGLSQWSHAPTPAQDASQIEPASLGRLLRLEVVTDTRRVVGVAQHAGVARLVDLLNWNEELSLALADVEVTPLETQGGAPVTWPQAAVRKQAIAFVIPHEVAPPAAAVTRRTLEYVEKRRWRVSVLLARFLVTGCFHLAPAADPANASLFWNSGFVPLTEAEAVFLPEPATTWKAPVLIVNAARVEAYCPPASLLDE